MADDEVAFPTLDAPEIAAIDALGKRRWVSAGEYLYREGDARYDFFVVVSGAVDIVVQADGEVIGHTPLEVHLIPKALRVIVPKPAPAPKNVPVDALPVQVSVATGNGL